MKQVEFNGLECVEIGNEVLRLLVAQSIGPRILSCSLNAEPNLFAELPDTRIEGSSHPAYSFYGGHRFWYAPEVPEITYVPDDDPVEIVAIDSGIRILQSPEERTGIQKIIEIRLPYADRAYVEVNHVLINKGLESRSIAPWAITQFPIGGTAILPQYNDQYLGGFGLQPNRNLALWPYTNIQDERLALDNQTILINASPATPFKIGIGNPRGWLAYFYQKVLFVKFAPYHLDQQYLDLGACSQCYCNEEFLELETLGPEEVLDPGQQVSHREVWEVYDGVHFDISDVQNSLGPLGLDNKYTALFVEE